MPVCYDNPPGGEVWVGRGSPGHTAQPEHGALCKEWTELPLDAHRMDLEALNLRKNTKEILWFWCNHTILFKVRSRIGKRKYFFSFIINGHVFFFAFPSNICQNMLVVGPS